MIRKPAVAGMFYAADEQRLADDIDQWLHPPGRAEQAIGVIVPHAGYAYSGACAGKAYGRLRVPETVVIMGVNHRGAGPAFAVDGHDCWRTPLGDCRVDSAMRSSLKDASPLFQIDTEAAREEHSLEVQVPFIQRRNPGAAIVPITISSLNAEALVEAGEALAGVIADSKQVVMVASTDMSHYVSVEQAQRQDRRAIVKIEALDPAGLIETVLRNRISMCGAGPTAMMIAAAKKLGAADSQLVEYTHSGVATGDTQQVVAYLSMIVS